MRNARLEEAQTSIPELLNSIGVEVVSGLGVVFTTPADVSRSAEDRAWLRSLRGSPALIADDDNVRILADPVTWSSLLAAFAVAAANEFGSTFGKGLGQRLLDHLFGPSGMTPDQIERLVQRFVEQVRQVVQEVVQQEAIDQIEARMQGVNALIQYVRSRPPEEHYKQYEKLMEDIQLNSFYYLTKRGAGYLSLFMLIGCTLVAVMLEMYALQKSAEFLKVVRDRLEDMKSVVLKWQTQISEIERNKCELIYIEKYKPGRPGGDDEGYTVYTIGWRDERGETHLRANGREMNSNEKDNLLREANEELAARRSANVSAALNSTTVPAIGIINKLENGIS